jgi:hypothetical protein
MKIKPGDIVEYRGRQVRVMTMGITSSGPRFTLSHFGWCGATPGDDLKLIKSIPKPTIKDYDDVIVHPISDSEKKNYGVGWGRDMDGLESSNIAHEITHVQYNDRYGWIGRIDGYNFQLYHIEAVNNFDMI